MMENQLNKQQDINVLFSFFGPPRRENSNPYSADLINNLKDSHSIQPVYLTLKNILRTPVDVIHVQWPEYLVQGPNFFKNAYKRLLTTLLLLRARIFSIPIIRTIHNITPHEGSNYVESFFLRWIDKSTTFRIVLNESPENPSEDTCVILHPRYAKTIELQRSEKFSNKILTFGAVRPYKGIEGLITAFQQLDSEDEHLIIAGKPLTEEYGDSLQTLVQEDERVKMNFCFLPEPDLQELILDSDLVVLPYKNIYNSGAALLALSLGVPILLTRSPSTESLQVEFGDNWVHLFDLPLTPSKLSSAHKEAMELRATGAYPDLARRNNSEHASLHANIYRSFSNQVKALKVKKVSPCWGEEARLALQNHSERNKLPGAMNSDLIDE